MSTPNNYLLTHAGTIPPASAQELSKQQFRTMRAGKPTSKLIRPIRFHNVSSARELILTLGSQYMSSFPGPNNVPSNQLLHGNLNRLRNRTVYLPLSVVESIFHQLEFRLTLAHRATRLLETAKIALPNGLRCNQFDEYTFRRQKAEHPNSLEAKKYGMAQRMIFTTVLPNPKEDTQGPR